MGIRCADHVTPLYPQKLALTSPNGGGRSVGIVRLRTKATEFSLVFSVYVFTIYMVVCLYVCMYDMYSCMYVWLYVCTYVCMVVCVHVFRP